MTDRCWPGSRLKRESGPRCFVGLSHSGIAAARRMMLIAEAHEYANAHGMWHGAMFTTTRGYANAIESRRCGDSDYMRE
jgi:hypothetical protein